MLVALVFHQAISPIDFYHLVADYCHFFFFFSSRRRHTRLTCDWSSDVCSSDLRRIQLSLRSYLIVFLPSYNAILKTAGFSFEPMMMNMADSQASVGARPGR